MLTLAAENATCPMEPEAAERCMWGLAEQAVSTAEFALLLCVLLLALSLFICILITWLTNPRL